MVGYTHPIQILFTGAGMAFDVWGLQKINAFKRNNEKPPQVTWKNRQLVFRFYIVFIMFLNCLMDMWYPCDQLFVMPIKAYVFAFPLGLIDLYYSDTRGVSMSTLAGASLWCFCWLLRSLFFGIRYGFSNWGMNSGILTSFGPISLGMELIRYTLLLIFSGTLSDLIFSPMHRWEHGSTYKDNHKVHHEFTNKLTALVLFYGTYLDDFMMPLTTTFGGIAYVLLAEMLFGLQASCFSNFATYLIALNILLSHAHDARCANLIAPLPDELNFVSYHYVHHIHPNRNFGLTEPSDKLWDWILGVNTIEKFKDIQLAQEKDDVD